MIKITLTKWQLALILLGNFLFSWFFMAVFAQSGSRSITINKIIIPNEELRFVTPQGKVLGALAKNSYGGQLTIRNNQGNIVGGMAAMKNGGDISIFYNTGGTSWSAPFPFNNILTPAGTPWFALLSTTNKIETNNAEIETIKQKEEDFEWRIIRLENRR